MFPKRMLAPGFLTVLNLFLGFNAVILVAAQNYVTASWLIILAGIFDAFDGKVARATKSYSEFGIEFDSLADVLSFGVAPSFLVYQVHLNKMGPAGLVISFFPLVFGAIRLARFNVHISGFEKGSYEGLPIPAAAATLASFVIFNYHFWDEMWMPSLILPLVIILSLLMVSTLEFDPLPNFSFRHGRKNNVMLAILLGGVTLVIFFPQEALFPLALAYIVYSIARGLTNLGKGDDNGNNHAIDHEIELTEDRTRTTRHNES